MCRGAGASSADIALAPDGLIGTSNAVSAPTVRLRVDAARLLVILPRQRHVPRRSSQRGHQRSTFGGALIAGRKMANLYFCESFFGIGLDLQKLWVTVEIR